MTEVIQGGVCANWQGEITCQRWDEYDLVAGCGAILSVTETDFVAMYYMGDFFPHYYIAVQCPQCKKYVKVRNIPKALHRSFLTPERKAEAVFDGVRGVV